MRAVSPSGVFGGKNSNEMSGRPAARSSVIFRGRLPGYCLEPFFSSAFTFWYLR